MKAIHAATLVFCFSLAWTLGAAGAALPEPGQLLRIESAGGCLLFPRPAIVASAFSRIGRKVADKTREEKVTTPSKSYPRATTPKYTPAPKPAVQKAPIRRSVTPVSPPKPLTVSRPSVRTSPGRIETTPRTSSRLAAPVRRSGSSTAPRSTVTSRPPRPTSTASAAPIQILGRRVSETTQSRTPSTTQSRAITTRRTTGFGSIGVARTRSTTNNTSQSPGVVGRGTVSTVARSGSGTSATRGHSGAGVTSRYSRGHAGGYVTSRYSRGHAGSYVTSRYSRGHAGEGVTSRYSRGHAGAGVTSGYSRGHYLGNSTLYSRWDARSRRVQTTGHHYRYYGRGSRYYFCHGLWLPLPPGHIHGPGCGHAYRYSRWVAVDIVAYPVFVPTPVYADYYYEGGWHAEPPPVYVAEGIIVTPEEELPVSGPPSLLTKAEREFEIITRTFDLDWWQARRVEDLISKRIIESLLAGGEAGEDSRIVFDKRKQELTVTATPDDIMRIRTIVDDDRTYRLFTQEDLGNLVADAVPLVDLRFAESDPSGALRIAADNYSAADAVLRSSEVSVSGREWWFNDNIGSMTIMDSAQNLDTVYEFLETRPYLP